MYPARPKIQFKHLVLHNRSNAKTEDRVMEAIKMQGKEIGSEHHISGTEKR